MARHLRPSLETARIRDGRIFRVEGWTNALIVTGDVRAALEKERVTGLSYRLVSGPDAPGAG